MLLYLDIDGVMVPANSWRKPEILEDGFPEFSSMAVKSLNKILSGSNADIVLTTSHKHEYSLSKWKEMFKRRNIQVSKISRLPKNKNFLNRKDELLEWFKKEAPRTNFLIIDDDKSLNGLPDTFKKYLIQPSGSLGLTEQLADEALKLIENSNSIAS